MPRKFPTGKGLMVTGPRRVRPLAEALESRELLSTYYVATTPIRRR
jgi:hypothetical protein